MKGNSINKRDFLKKSSSFLSGVAVVIARPASQKKKTPSYATY
jgi:hypothetical protein